MKEKNYQLSNNLIEYSKRAKVLEKDEEFKLISQWRDHKNQNALQKILNSYMRLSVSYARKYSNYGLSLDDLIHEGILGIMHALEKFDISKNFRLSTYASWWIRASMQDYILKNWSIVKTGSTASQKQLFFNLKKIKNQISPKSEGDLKDEHVSEIARKLDVKKDEVISMNRRLQGKEHSLNAQIGEDGDEWQDWLVDKKMDQELKFAQKEEMDQRKDLLQESIKVLNDREREILYARRLADETITLEDLSKKYKISRERVRQIENKAFEKVQKHMLNSARSKNLLPVN